MSTPLKTVADLQAYLSDKSPSLPVMVDGYEGGYSHPNPVMCKVLGPDKVSWYYGDYEDDENGVEALILSRS